MRDYIHVVDLAVGHVAALKKLEENCGCKVTINNLLGSKALVNVRRMVDTSGEI